MHDDEWILPGRKNPYSSASGVDPGRQGREEPTSEELDRDCPPGVTIVGILNILAGLACFCLFLPAFASLPKASAGALPLVAGLAFAAIILTVSGIGLVRGNAWAWWLIVFSYAFSLMRNSTSMLILGAWPDSALGPTAHVAVVAVRIVFQGVVLVYLLRRHVLAYFRLSHLNRFLAVGVLCSIAFVFVVMWYIALDMLVSGPTGN